MPCAYHLHALREHIHPSAHVIKEFLKEYSLLIPCLMAFSLASRSGLKSWIAVSSLPPPLAIDDKEKTRFSRISRLACVFTLMTLVVVEYLIFTSSIETRDIETYLLVSLGVSVNSSLILLFIDMTRAMKWGVYRFATGSLRWRISTGSVNYYKLAPIVVGATILNVQSYVTQNTTLASVVSTALIYRLVSSTPRAVHSVRKVILLLTGMVFFYTLLSGAMIMMLMKLGKNQPGEEEEPIMIVMEPFSPKFVSYFNTFIASMVSSVPGLLISVCYRFDYHQHLSRTSTTETPILLESIAAPATSNYLTSGVVAPLRAPTRFSRPLYITSLLSWFTSYISVALLFKHLPALRELRKLDSAFDLISLAITIPSMVIMVLIVARLQGNLRTMWTYKEAWKVESIDKVDDGELGDEVVPAYKDVVEEDDILVPAYVEKA